MPAKLVELTGARRSFTLTASETTLGRGPANDIVLPDMKVSKHHARIVLKSKGFYLEDVGSTNGTFLGNTSIKLVHLRSNDCFRIGNSEFRFMESVAAQAFVPAPQSMPPTRGSVSIPGQSRPAVRSPYFLPLAIGGGVVFVILLMIFFLPLFAVQSGQITTCKVCNKEISNTVATRHVSYLEKDNYSVGYNKEYCESCGMVEVPYTVNTHCKQCGKAYKREAHIAPRREEKRDEDRTEGFCSITCEILYNLNTTLDKASGLRPDLLDLLP